MPTFSVPKCSLLLLLLVLRLPAVLSTLEAWFGTAPACMATPNDCHEFDLKFIRSDPRGDGSKCLRGNKVLCQPTPLEVALQVTPKKELVVVSYNVYEPLFSKTHDGQSERTCHIPRVLLNKYPDIDVVVLTGLFMGGCLQGSQASRKISIMDLLQNYGFVQFTPIQGESSRSIFKSNGGIVIASRWPITTFKEMVFTNYADSDKYSEKGAIWARVSKHGVLYNVIGTHMQEGADNSNVRDQQAEELQNFIQEVGVPTSQPVLIAGVFNTDNNGNPAQTKALVKKMRAEMPSIIGDVSATVDFSKNDMVDPKLATKEWLDYIVYSALHKKPNQATIEAFDLKADTSIKFCNSASLQPYYVSAGALLCGGTRTTKDLSNHFPVIGRFLFNT